MPSNYPPAATRYSACGRRLNTALNRHRGPMSLLVKSKLWMHVCVRQLPPKAALKSNCNAGDSPGALVLPAARNALKSMMRASQHGPESTQETCGPSGQKQTTGARMRVSAPVRTRIKVKLHRGKFPGIPRTSLWLRRADAHAESVQTRP